MESSVNDRKNIGGLGIHRVHPRLTEVAELKVRRGNLEHKEEVKVPF